MKTAWGTDLPKPLPDEASAIALSERALKLNALTQHPEWAELRAVMEERRDLHTRRLAASLIRGNVDQRLIDRHAGFWQGVFAVLDKPDEVEAELKKVLKKLETAESAQPTEGE